MDRYGCHGVSIRKILRLGLLAMEFNSKDMGTPVTI